MTDEDSGRLRKLNENDTIVFSLYRALLSIGICLDRFNITLIRFKT